MFAYCLNNPVNREDPSGCKSIWSFKSDAKGRSILWHYLFGKGTDLIKHNGSWGKYMQKNKGDPANGVEPLSEQMKGIVFPIRNSLRNGESRTVDITTSIAIQNGESIIGYQYLHGTNADVGGFQIQGNISRDLEGNTTYQLTYTWNDMIDPNFNYTSDIMKVAFAQKIPGANPTSYYICISWDDTTIINSTGKQNRGWLK